MRQVITRGKLSFVVCVSLLVLLGSSLSAEAYTINIRNDTKFMLTGVDVHAAISSLEQSTGTLRAGQTKSLQWTGIHAGVCFGKMRVWYQNYYDTIEQWVNIPHCGNLGVVIKFYDNVFYIETYPY